MPKLGLITTGHGPREEYFSFHRNLLRYLNTDVDITIRYALEGLTQSDIEQMLPAEEVPLIHGYIRVPGSKNKKFGEGWGECWMARDQTVPFIQDAIEELESEGADAIIYCCAEPYEEGAFHSKKPLVLPYRVVLSYAEALAKANEQAHIGILTGGTRQRAQQLEMWQRFPWARHLKLQFAELGDTPVQVAVELAKSKPDLVIYWGYGVGLAPGDDASLLAQMEAVLNQPILYHHVASTMFVRNYLSPSFPVRHLVEESSI